MGKKKKAERQQKNKKDVRMENLEQGMLLVSRSAFFGRMGGYVRVTDGRVLGERCAAAVTAEGDIFLNRDCLFAPVQWAHVIAHCKLHLAFGHFDREKMPGYGEEAAV